MRPLPLVGAVLLGALVTAGCADSQPALPDLPPRPASGGPDAGISAAPAAETGPAGSTPGPAGPVVVRQPDGSARVTDAGNGFELTLPPGFTRVTSKHQLDSLSRTGPAGLRAALGVGGGALTANVRLLAVAPAGGGTVHLLSTPAGGAVGSDLTGQAAAIRSQLQNSLGAPVTVTTTRVDGEPALRSQADVISSGTRVRVVQLYLVHGDRFWTATFGQAEPAGRSWPLRVARSLHFVDPAPGSGGPVNRG